MSFEKVGSETVWQGRIGSVRVDTFRYPDGEQAEREVIAHPGAVAIVAHDGERLFLVRQPREPVEEPALLELPAGTVIPIGWVAVGRPARLFPPDQHDAIWAMQEPLDFPGTVYGVPRGTSMRDIMRQQSAAYRTDR